jgi:hypothetical protein
MSYRHWRWRTKMYDKTKPKAAGGRGFRSYVIIKNRHYIKRAAARIAHAKRGGHEDWAAEIEAKAAGILAAMLLKEWPYDES